MNIHVSNLSLNIIDADLRRLFTQYGEVNSAEIIRDKYNGRSKGTALVNMPEEKEAQQAIISLDHSTMDGKIIKVEEQRAAQSW